MSDEPESPESPEQHKARQRTIRVVRRIGYVVFLGGGLAMFTAMMIGVVNGLRYDRAWNPYTGQRHRQVECLDRARALMLDARVEEPLDPKWVGRYRDWISRCRDNHPELYQLLSETRSVLQEREPDDPESPSTPSDR